MDSKYIFSHVDRLREESLMGMGRLGYKLKNEAPQIMKENGSEKKELSEIFQEIGGELKERITKLAGIGKRIKALEKISEEKKQRELTKLEIHMEIFQTAIELEENTRVLLNESLELYEKTEEEAFTPALLKDERFCNMIENIIKGINEMIPNLEAIFYERLKNKKKYGGTRAFYKV